MCLRNFNFENLFPRTYISHFFSLISFSVLSSSCSVIQKYLINFSLLFCLYFFPLSRVLGLRNYIFAVLFSSSIVIVSLVRPFRIYTLLSGLSLASIPTFCLPYPLFFVPSLPPTLEEEMRGSVQKSAYVSYHFTLSVFRPLKRKFPLKVSCPSPLHSSSLPFFFFF